MLVYWSDCSTWASTFRATARADELPQKVTCGHSATAVTARRTTRPRKTHCFAWWRHMISSSLEWFRSLSVGFQLLCRSILWRKTCWCAFWQNQRTLWSLSIRRCSVWTRSAFLLDNCPLLFWELLQKLLDISFCFFSYLFLHFVYDVVLINNNVVLLSCNIRQPTYLLTLQLVSCNLTGCVQILESYGI